MKVNIIDNFESIIKLIPTITNGTLFILDIDDVVIIPEDEHRLDHKERVDIIKEYSNKYSFEQRKHLFSIILQKQKMRLVDVEITKVLSILEKNAIPTIALTKSFTGKFGVITSVEDLLISRLNALGIDFKNSSPIKQEILIHEMINTGTDNTPIFKDGILMTANQDKGQALSYLFKKTNYYPLKIIFIDDKLENIKSLHKLTIEQKIEGQFYKYVGAKKVPLSTLNAKQEKLRFEILEYKHQWLTDVEMSTVNAEKKQSS